ncbi:MerR family transcriptional regulator [Dokdonella soli]|uniref:HTH merR-type domain-containing protein n=1 Tax=Dokdonella soli TaxID=529810 RepID=A0ABP3TXY2_9GAMM
MTLHTVSQIARRTGLTVRTLHHYEAKGLLRPAARSDAGYRLYGERELLRLQHIASLRALGFSLPEIRACLDADTPSLAEALARQVDRLRAAVVRQQDLLIRLERVAQQAATGETIDAETLLNSIEASTIMEKYFSPEQMQSIKQRGEALGPQHIREVEQAWPDVIAGMRAAMDLGKDPAAAEVQALARRWRGLVREFTGGDAGVQRSLNTMFKDNPDTMRTQTGIDPVLMAYACKAIGLLAD